MTPTTNIPTRLYIESDLLHEDEKDRSRNCVEFILQDMNTPFIPDIFNTMLGFAYHNMTQAWEAILAHDEIYASSSLYGLSGARVYVGAPPLFDGMMKLAVEKGVKGKSLFFLTHVDDILWDNIDFKLLKKAFAKNNKLFCTDEETGLFVQVNPADIIKKYKTK